MQIGKVAVEPLIACLNDSNLRVRLLASDALVLIGRPAVPSLMEALEGSNEDIKNEADVILDRILGGSGRYSYAGEVLT